MVSVAALGVQALAYESAYFLEAHDLLLILDAEGAHDVLQLLIAPGNRSGLLDELGLLQLLYRPGVLLQPAGTASRNGWSVASL